MLDARAPSLQFTSLQLSFFELDRLDADVRFAGTESSLSLGHSLRCDRSWGLLVETRVAPGDGGGNFLLGESLIERGLLFLHAKLGPLELVGEIVNHSLERRNRQRDLAAGFVGSLVRNHLPLVELVHSYTLLAHQPELRLKLANARV
jgi:hypothetical protein